MCQVECTACTSILCIALYNAIVTPLFLQLRMLHQSSDAASGAAVTPDALSCASPWDALQAILALMSDAAPDSPLNCDAGNLLRAGDIRGYNALARMYTMEYGMAQK
jgi:hypothetical protein